MHAPPPRVFALLLAGALLGTLSSTPLSAACTHLGQPVQCPPGVADGSNSLQFVPGGILWSDGTTTIGNSVPPISPAPPGGGAPPGQAAPDPGSGGTTPANDPKKKYVPGADHPVLPGGAVPGAAAGDTSAGADIAHDAGLDLVLGGAVPALPPIALGADGIAPVNESSVTNTELFPLDLTPIFVEYKGTFDLAGAAEAIVKNGSGISYSNDAKDFVDSTVSGQKLATDCHEINCIEFVHLAAWAAGNQQNNVQGTPNVGSAGAGVFGGKISSVVWDGKSDIPRGCVIIGVGRFRNYNGFNHCGVSLGNGKVAHHNSGFLSGEKDAHPKIDKVGDAFGWIAYSEIRIVYYDFQKQQYDPSAPAAPDPTAPGGLVPQPTVTPDPKPAAPASAPQSAASGTASKAP